LLALKTNVNVPTVKINKETWGKNYFFVGILKATEEKSRLRNRDPVVLYGSADLDPYQKLTDPEHCLRT
jgi:hypothetical protein